MENRPLRGSHAISTSPPYHLGGHNPRIIRTFVCRVPHHGWLFI